MAIHEVIKIKLHRNTIHGKAADDDEAAKWLNIKYIKYHDEHNFEMLIKWGKCWIYKHIKVYEDVAVYIRYINNSFSKYMAKHK